MNTLGFELLVTALATQKTSKIHSMLLKWEKFALSKLH